MAVSPTLLAGCSVRAGQRDAVTSRGVVACAVRAAATNVSCRVSSAPATSPWRRRRRTRRRADTARSCRRRRRHDLAVSARLRVRRRRRQGLVAGAEETRQLTLVAAALTAQATTPLDVTASRWPARTEHPARSVGDTAIYQVMKER